MSLNCNPGDLAMIVGNANAIPCVAAHVGHTVRLKTVAGLHAQGGHLWLFEGPALECTCGVSLRALFDLDLLSLSPPLLPGVDEMILRAGRPAKGRHA